MEEITNYYGILGVNPRATEDEIKRAYRAQQLIHHPDKGGDAELCKKLNQAYKILSDALLRRDFDQEFDDEEDDVSFGGRGDKSSFQLPPDGERASERWRQKVAKWEEEYNSGNGISPLNLPLIVDTIKAFVSQYDSILSQNAKNNRTEDVYYCHICEKFYPSDDTHYTVAVQPYTNLFEPHRDEQLYPTTKARFGSTFGENVTSWEPSRFSHSEETLAFWGSPEWKNWNHVQPRVTKLIQSTKINCEWPGEKLDKINFTKLPGFLLNDVTFKNTDVKIKLDKCLNFSDQADLAGETLTILVDDAASESRPPFPNPTFVANPPGKFQNAWHCSYCDVTFGYVIPQRHHCRRCGKTVCLSCSLPNQRIFSVGYSSARMCATCIPLETTWTLQLWTNYVIGVINETKDETCEDDVIELFALGCINFDWHSGISPLPNDCKILLDLAKKTKMYKFYLALARFFTLSQQSWEEIAIFFCSKQLFGFAAKCILSMNKDDANWESLAHKFAKYDSFAQLSAHCVLEARLLPNQLFSLTKKIFALSGHKLTPLVQFCANFTLVRNQKEETAPFFAAVGKMLIETEMRPLAFYFLDEMKAEVQEGWIDDLGNFLWTQNHYDALHLLFKYRREKLPRADVIPAGSPILCALYLQQGSSNESDYAVLVTLATTMLKRLLKKKSVDAILPLGTYLNSVSSPSKNWIHDISENAETDNEILLLCAKLSKLFDSGDIYYKMGMALRQRNDKILADLCFLVGRTHPENVADDFYDAGDHKSAIEYYLQVGDMPERILWEKGEALMTKGGDKVSSYFYFWEIIKKIEPLPRPQKIPVYIDLAILLFGGDFNSGLQNVFKTIVAEFRDEFENSDAFQDLHEFMLAQFLKQEDNEKLAIAVLHYLPGKWDVASKQKFSSSFSPQFKTRVTTALESYNLESLAEALVDTNARNVASLEQIICQHDYFCNLDVEKLPAIFKISYHMITGCILKVRGDVVRAINHFNACLHLSPQVGRATVNSAISILLDFHLHFQTVQSLLDELMRVSKKCDKHVTLPDPFHKFKAFLNFKGNQELVTIRKVEAAIKNQAIGFEAAMSYLDFSASADSGTVLISCWTCAISKLVDTLTTKNLEDGRVYAISSLICELVTVVFLFTRRICTPHFEGIISAWLLKALIIAGKSMDNIRLPRSPSPSIKILLQKLLESRIGCLKVNPFVLDDTFYPILDNLYVSMIQAEFQKHFFTHRITNPYCHTGILPTHLFAYHKFDGVWRGWIDDDFLATKQVCIDAILAKKFWREDMVKDNLEWGLQPRDADGFVRHCNKLSFVNAEKTTKLLPRQKSYESFDGFIFDKNTGKVEFLLRNRPLLLNLVKGRKPKLFSLDDVMEVCREEISAAFFTLEEPSGGENFRSHPFQEMRFGPSRLKGTNYLATMARADILLKEITTGVEISSTPPFRMRSTSVNLLQNLPPDLHEILGPIKNDKVTSLLQECVHRFWIEIDDIPYKMEETEGAITVRFGPVAARLCTRPMTRNLEGELEDVFNEGEDTPEEQFAKNFTQSYDKIGTHFPELLRLKELMKMSFMARILKGIARSVQSSREEAETQAYYEDLCVKTKSELRRIYSQISSYPQCTPAKIREVLNDAARSAGISTYQLGYDERNKLESKIRAQLEKSDADVLNHYCSTFSETFGLQSTLQFRDRVRDWLSSGRLDTLGDDLARAAVQKILREAGQVLANLLGLTGISPLERDKNEEIENRLTCSWVPAAFCNDSEDGSSVRKVYGGVSMMANGVCTSGITSSLGTSRVSAGGSGSRPPPSSAPPAPPPPPPSTGSRSMAGRTAKLREIMNDPKQGSHIRGWIRQEVNQIERGQRNYIRNPPGHDLAHWRGYESAKGYDYSHSNLQVRDLHKLQHKYDKNGKLNKDRGRNE